MENEGNISIRNMKLDKTIKIKVSENLDGLIKEVNNTNSDDRTS